MTRIHIRVKIWIRIQIGTYLSPYSGALEAENRAVNAHIGGVKAQNEAIDGLGRQVVADSYQFAEERVTDPYQSKNSDPH
jgi:hypothetical protein